LTKFLARENIFKCTYKNYHCGGNGSAMLLMLDKIEDPTGFMRECAEELMNDAQRDPDNGIFSMPDKHGKNINMEKYIWIDTVFAVTPFLLYCGIAFDEDKYIEEGFQQMKKMFDIFRDENAHRTMHQSRDFAGPGKLSEDHWSRGNGWGLYGATELVKYLSDADPRREEAERLFKDLVLGCLEYQDEDGMWHQEITDHTSFVETSGTGLILYALGVGLEKGIIDSSYMENFQNGLKGYLKYIALDGSIYHTCQGCLCPGEGTIEDYKAKKWVLNDSHAFGPALFTFAQANKMGIKEI
jgi:unsaturated rhamnogalacturonyl hydrolase